MEVYNHKGYKFTKYIWTASQYYFSLELHENKDYGKQKSIHKWTLGIRVFVQRTNSFLLFTSWICFGQRELRVQVLQSILSTYVMFNKHIGLFAQVCPTDIYGQANYLTNIWNSGGNTRWSSGHVKSKMVLHWSPFHCLQWGQAFFQHFLFMFIICWNRFSFVFPEHQNPQFKNT